jgi:hypothetical protein
MDEGIIDTLNVNIRKLFVKGFVNKLSHLVEGGKQ